MTLGNPKLTWEKTNTLDVGLNMGFLNDRVSLNFAYYCKKTTDLIDDIQVRKSSGFTSYSVNAGGIKNEGIEIGLNATLFRNRDWMVAVSATLAHNKNTITELGEDVKLYNEAMLKEMCIRDRYTRFATVYSNVLIFRLPDKDITNQRFLFQFRELSCLGHTIVDHKSNFTHRCTYHEEKQQHEHDVR